MCTCLMDSYYLLIYSWYNFYEIPTVSVNVLLDNLIYEDFQRLDK